MKDRADYARKGIARGPQRSSPSPTTTASSSAPRTRRPTLAQDQRDLRPHRLRRGRQVQRVRPAAHRRRAPRRPQGLLVQPRGRRRPQPGQQLRPDARPGLHPRDEADGGRDPRRRGRRTTPADDQLFHILYDGTVIDEHRLHRARRRGRAPSPTPHGGAAWPGGSTSPTRSAPRSAPSPGPDRTLDAPTTSRSRCSTATAPAGRSGASSDESSSSVLRPPDRGRADGAAPEPRRSPTCVRGRAAR